MTKENQDKVIALNAIAQASYIQIVKKNNPLLNEGYLMAVEPANKAQAYFVGKDQTIVKVSKKGVALLTSLLPTKAV